MKAFLRYQPIIGSKLLLPHDNAFLGKDTFARLGYIEYVEYFVLRDASRVLFVQAW